MCSKILFLNLPHRLDLYRRYLCSYHSPGSLLPPYDLVQLATCVREWNHATVRVIDAIAENKTEAQVYSLIAEDMPDLIITITGIEFFGDDMDCIERLQERFPAIPLGIFGYYPTVFPEKTLQHSKVDFVLCREPELPLSQYIKAVQGQGNIDDITGLAGRCQDGSLFYNREERVTDLDSLPFPDYSLVEQKLYTEAFTSRTCAAILSIRGCPFDCTYCNTTYGRKTVRKSPERVVEEIAYHLSQGAQNIRFLDDTFTISHDWGISICKLILEKKLSFEWACLSRVDTVDEEVLHWMHRAGCRRILVGVESYSQSFMNLMNKKVDTTMTNRQLRLMKKAGMELVGHFIVGAPLESDEDFRETVKGALASPLDFIIVNLLTPYAGTRYFEQVSEYYSFNLLPYECRLLDDRLQARAYKRFRTLYRRFYCRPSVLLRHFYYLSKDPRHILKAVKAFL